jgi:glycerol-3-phosphate cytidylyltransferase-like family protein
MTTETEQPAEALAEVKEEPVSLDEVSTETEAKDEPKPEEGKTEDAGDGDEDKPKKPSGAQRAKLREARLIQELSQREREIEELRRSSPAVKASETDEKEPVEADFSGDFFAFQHAMTAFKAGKAARDAIEKVFQTREQKDNAEKQASVARERREAHLERVEDAREVIADFDQVMKAMDGVKVRNDVIDEIMSSDKSAEISYFLAKNPQKLAEMDRMSGKELAREMGRLEATLKLPTAKKQTSAPAPLSALKGGASGSFDPEKASMDDYVAKRKAGWKG